MAICKYCKQDNPDGKKFCMNCGAQMVNPISRIPNEQIEMPLPVEPAQQALPQESVSPNPIPQHTDPQQNVPPQPQPYVAQEGPNSQHFEPANTIPFNAKDQQEYAEKLNNPDKVDHENISVMAFVLGWVCLFFNPLLLVSLTAIILGIIGHANQGSKKKLAKIGWILGLIGLVVHLTLKILAALAIISVGRFLLLTLF